MGRAGTSRVAAFARRRNRRGENMDGRPNAAAPEITDAQRAFVTASEEAEATRLGKERAQLEAEKAATGR